MIDLRACGGMSGAKGGSVYELCDELVTHASTHAFAQAGASTTQRPPPSSHSMSASDPSLWLAGKVLCRAGSLGEEDGEAGHTKAMVLSALHRYTPLPHVLLHMSSIHTC